MATCNLLSISSLSFYFLHRQTSLWDAKDSRRCHFLNAPVLASRLAKSTSNLKPPCSSFASFLDRQEKNCDQVDDSGQVKSKAMATDGDALFRVCKSCGREGVDKNCNGEGRIQGGIAIVKGFSWWPIKCYRPCPSFVASGGKYVRQGQTLEEFASGVPRKNSSFKRKKRK